MLGQEVQCLKVLGLRLLDHTVVMVVVPDVVQVVINMTLDLVAVALAFTPLADHVFLMVIAFPLVDHVFPFEVITLLLCLG
jgi:hypothetical protein